MSYKEKLQALEKELKILDLYITKLKGDGPQTIKALHELKAWEVKFRRTMIRYRTLLINNNEAA